jgi:hypothetical protein
MSTAEFTPDTQTTDLELQWRRAHEATMSARTHYEAVAERLRALANVFEKARERLDILEILEARSLAELKSERRECGRPAETMIDLR